jgi:hypothetical protein
VHGRLPRSFQQEPGAADQSCGSETDTKRDGRGKRMALAHTRRHRTGQRPGGSIRTINENKSIILNALCQSERSNNILAE